MNIGILGSGFVGKRTGKMLAQFHKVFYYDIIPAEDGSIYTNVDDVVRETEVGIVCVPTPTRNGKQDLSIVFDVVEKVNKAAEKLNKKEYTLVMKSTVAPGTGALIMDAYPNLKYVSNPEFITQINKSWTDNPAFNVETGRIIIGTNDSMARLQMKYMYEKLGKEVHELTVQEAELCKYINNTCLASRISFFNEIFLLCRGLGVDGYKLAKLIGTDNRIGEYGTVCGRAYGGTCLPKDTKAFIEFAEKIGVDVPVLKATDATNEKMKKQFGVREEQRTR